MFQKKTLVFYIFFSVGILSSLFGDESLEYEAYKQQIQAVAEVETKKLNDLVKFLEDNGISPSIKSSHLNLGEYLSMGLSHGEAPGKIEKLRTIQDEPIVFVSIDSKLSYELEPTDVIYVFGMVAGTMRSRSETCIEQCPSFSIEGNVYKFRISSRNAYNGVIQAPTSMTLIGPNAMLKLTTDQAFPTTIYSYLVTSTQFKENPQAFKEFTERFISLKRN